MTRRIPIVTTSTDRMGESGKPTGVWAEELAVPFRMFRDAGIEVVIASTRGGPVPFDPRGTSGEHAAGPEIRRLFEEAGDQLRASLPVAGTGVDGFDALFFPGGHGTMWDMPDNPDVAERVRAMFEAGRVVAAVCHGPAALVGARLSDGRPLVQGRRLTSFTDEEERAVGLHEVVPFLLESRLRELGALFEAAPKFQPHTVRDGHLITGQNPASSAGTARAVLEALGLA